MMWAASTTTRKPAGLWRYFAALEPAAQVLPWPAGTGGGSGPATSAQARGGCQIFEVPAPAMPPWQDFPQPAEIRRWSDERSMQARRRRNLARRVRSVAPLFADELIACELRRAARLLRG